MARRGRPKPYGGTFKIKSAGKSTRRAMDAAAAIDESLGHVVDSIGVLYGKAVGAYSYGRLGDCDHHLDCLLGIDGDFEPSDVWRGRGMVKTNS
jgi:hypothetical protein